MDSAGPRCIFNKYLQGTVTWEVFKGRPEQPLVGTLSALSPVGVWGREVFASLHTVSSLP